MTPASIDIGSDVGEYFAVPACGVGIDALARLDLPGRGRLHERHLRARSDEAILKIATSVHLAAGLHSGDPVAMYRTAAELAPRGINLGAHPSYPDLFRFGQNRMDLTPEETKATILYQIGAVAAVLRLFGREVSHVKLHGALGIDAAYDERRCDVLLAAIEAYDRDLPLYLIAGSPSIAHARGRGFNVVAEGIADRNFDGTGRVLPRSHPEAEIHDPETAAERLMGMLRTGRVAAIDGTMVEMPVESVCLHSDTPGAAEIAEAVTRRLDEAGIARRPYQSV